MFGNDRNAMRRYMTDAWVRAQRGETLEPLQEIIVAIIRQHPEYQRLFEDPEKAVAAEWTPEGGETNPFLHIGMHISLQEQISTDRPPGISALYRQMIAKSDPHEVEHRMMECLGRSLWEAQRAGKLPDQDQYLECIRHLL